MKSINKRNPKTSILLNSFLISFMLFYNSCEQKTAQDTPKDTKTDSTSVVDIDLSGRYTFAESKGKTKDGLGIGFIYSIEIIKEDDEYFAKYKVDGYQTMTRIECISDQIEIDQDENKGKLVLKFDRYGEDDMFKNENLYLANEELFTLSFELDSTNENIQVTFNEDFPTEDQAGKTFTFEKLEAEKLDPEEIQNYSIEEYYSLWVKQEKEEMQKMTGESKWTRGEIEIKDIPNGYMKVKGIGGFTGWHTLTLWKAKNGKVTLGVLSYGCGPICGPGSVQFYEIRDDQFVEVTKEIFPIKQQIALQTNCFDQNEAEHYPQSDLFCWINLPRVGTSIQMGFAKLDDQFIPTYQKKTAELKYNPEDGSFKLYESQKNN